MIKSQGEQYLVKWLNKYVEINKKVFLKISWIDIFARCFCPIKYGSTSQLYVSAIWVSGISAEGHMTHYSICNFSTKAWINPIGKCWKIILIWSNDDFLYQLNFVYDRNGYFSSVLILVSFLFHSDIVCQWQRVDSICTKFDDFQLWNLPNYEWVTEFRIEPIHFSVIELLIPSKWECTDKPDNSLLETSYTIQ